MKYRITLPERDLPDRKKGVLYQTALPIPHEAVSSWLQRFGQMHSVTPMEVLKEVIAIKTMPRDIDLDLSINEISRLEYFANLPENSFALNHALMHHTRRLYVFYWRIQSPFRWLMQRQGHTSPHFGFCPSCLSLDETPYWRVEWRFRHWKVCPEHHCWIQVLCPHCKRRPNLVRPHLIRHRKYREGMLTARTLAQCARCGLDLYSGEIVTPRPDEVDYYIRLQRALLSTLVNGYCILVPTPHKRDVGVAIRYLRMKKLHPIGPGLELDRQA